MKALHLLSLLLITALALSSVSLSARPTACIT
jgi:hypothetical protein